MEALMAQVKGTLLNAWKSFLIDRYAEEKVSTAIESLDASDKLHLMSPILDSTWYPMELQQVMSKLTKALAARSDGDIASQLGRYTADYVLASVYRTVIANDSKKNKSVSWFDDLLYRGLRECKAEYTGPTSYVTWFYYLEGKPTAGQCRTLRAFLIRVSELRGRKNVTCIHRKCLARGGDCCEFLMEWD
jgi:hypothetical protein